MSNVKQGFVENLMKELKIASNNRGRNGKTPLDVCYLISSVDEHIEECKEFIEDITNNTYYINGYEEDCSQGYSNGKIRISIEKPEGEDISNYCYYIQFLYESKEWDFNGCDSCRPKDDAEHNYHDNGCSPSFKLTKEINMYYGVFEELDGDYRKYELAYNKTQSIKDINLQIKELQNKLGKL